MKAKASPYYSGIVVSPLVPTRSNIRWVAGEREANQIVVWRVQDSRWQIADSYSASISRASKMRRKGSAGLSSWRPKKEFKVESGLRATPIIPEEDIILHLGLSPALHDRKCMTVNLVQPTRNVCWFPKIRDGVPCRCGLTIACGSHLGECLLYGAENILPNTTDVLYILLAAIIDKNDTNLSQTRANTGREPALTNHPPHCWEPNPWIRLRNSQEPEQSPFLHPNLPIRRSLSHT